MQRIDLQQLVLDLLSTKQGVDASHFVGVMDEDWHAIVAMVQQHRLGPLLHWQLEHEQCAARVPREVREVLATAFRHSTYTSLMMQGELVSLARVLHDAGIPMMALKGADLAYSSYPHSALRPMRDLDVLVPRDRALAAYDVLLHAGYRRVPEYPGDVMACMTSCAHLPQLHSPRNQLCVEVHVQLTDFTPSDEESAYESGLWTRRVSRKLAEEVIGYLSPTDLALHLIVHAVYRHQFNNGPLLLTDLAYLVRGREIDWDLFWQVAGQRGWTRGCILCLTLTEKYHGNLDIRFPERHRPSGLNELVSDCSMLTLTDIEVRGNVAVTSALFGKPLHQKVANLLRNAFPPKAVMMSRSDGGRLGIFGAHLYRFHHIFARRLPSLWKSRRDSHVVGAARTVVKLQRWLTQS